MSQQLSAVQDGPRAAAQSLPAASSSREAALAAWSMKEGVQSQRMLSVPAYLGTGSVPRLDGLDDSMQEDKNITHVPKRGSRARKHEEDMDSFFRRSQSFPPPVALGNGSKSTPRFWKSRKQDTRDGEKSGTRRLLSMKANKIRAQERTTKGLGPGSRPDSLARQDSILEKAKRMLSLPSRMDNTNEKKRISRRAVVPNEEAVDEEEEETMEDLQRKRQAASEELKRKEEIIKNQRKKIQMLQQELRQDPLLMQQVGDVRKELMHLVKEHYAGKTRVVKEFASSMEQERTRVIEKSKGVEKLLAHVGRQSLAKEPRSLNFPPVYTTDDQQIPAMRTKSLDNRPVEEDRGVDRSVRRFQSAHHTTMPLRFNGRGFEG